MCCLQHDVTSLNWHIEHRVVFFCVPVVMHVLWVVMVDRLCEPLVTSVALVLVVDRLCEPVATSVALVVVVVWYVVHWGFLRCPFALSCLSRFAYIDTLSPRLQIASLPSLVSQRRHELPELWIQMVNGLLLYLLNSFYLERVLCKIFQNESYFSTIEPTMNHWLTCLQLMTLSSNQFRDTLVTSAVVFRTRNFTKKVWELLSMKCFISS